MSAKRRGGIVYSTSGNQPAENKSQSSVPHSEQDLRVHLDRLKGNKVVTRISGYTGSDQDLMELGRLIKSKCGVGGNTKNGEILVQGDHRMRVGEILEGEGIRFKLSGG